MIKTPSRGDMLGALARWQKNTGIGVGGGKCGTPMKLGQRYTDPRCYDMNYLNCCHEIVAESSLSVAGQSAFTIQVEPENSPYFRPCAVAAMVTDSVDPGLKRVARFTSVSIQNCPQENIDDPAPTAATTQFWLSTQWDPEARDGCACPISWGTFSNRSNSYPLRVVGFNPHPIGISIDVTILVYGDECGPPCCKPGHDKGHNRPEMPPPRPVPGNAPAVP